MVEVFVLAEGQTEEVFIKLVVAPALKNMDIFVKAILINDPKRNLGGAVNLERVKSRAHKIWNANRSRYLTTLIDLYALDTSFPNFEESKKKSDIYTRTACLENGLHRKIIEHLGCPPECFIPHIQPHEIEALLFSDVHTLCNTPEISPNWAGLESKLNKVFKEKGIESPEHINGGHQTTPARRLEANLPRYRKTTHGPIGAKYITLPVIERECRHFREWMDKLRALATTQP